MPLNLIITSVNFKENGTEILMFYCARLNKNIKNKYL